MFKTFFKWLCVNQKWHDVLEYCSFKWSLEISLRKQQSFFAPNPAKWRRRAKKDVCFRRLIWNRSEYFEVTPAYSEYLIDLLIHFGIYYPTYTAVYDVKYHVNLVPRLFLLCHPVSLWEKAWERSCLSVWKACWAWFSATAERHIGSVLGSRLWRLCKGITGCYEREERWRCLLRWIQRFG